MINYYDLPENDLPMSMRFFRKSLKKRGWRAEKLCAESLNNLILTRPDGVTIHIASSTPPTTSVYSLRLADNKLMSYELLRELGVPQPEAVAARTAAEVLPMIEKYKVTTFCAPPTIYRFLIKEDLSKYDFSSLTHCSTAGEPLNPEVSKEFTKATGLEIYEGFGQTESSVLLGTYKFLEIKQGSMGKPSPIYDIYLADNNENEVADGETGEICIKMRENQLGLLYKYHKDEERTFNTFGSGVYHTGDLATKDSDGYYWFVGRKDDIIKSSGYRIGPFEVESALHEHPAVLECAITGAPDPLRGQVVKATIVLAKGYSPSEELTKELQNHVKKATAPYKYPRIVEYVTELPKTISGKIIRKEIAARDNKKQG